MATPASCWTTFANAAHSGGEARFCSTSGPILAFTAAANTASPVLQVHGYADLTPRGFRVRIDSAAWTPVVVPSVTPAERQRLLWTSAGLSAGNHLVEFEWTGGPSATLDFVDLVDGVTTTTAPTTTVPTTSTTATSSTTTTSASSTTVPPTTTSSSTTTTDPGPEIVQLGSVDDAGVVMVLALMCLTLGVVSGSALLRGRR